MYAQRFLKTPPKWIKQQNSSVNLGFSFRLFHLDWWQRTKRTLMSHQWRFNEDATFGDTIIS